MTNHSHNLTPTNPPAVSQGEGALEDLDLTPAGLADAPAHQQDPQSLVHTGNS
ncbi:hypothetical protein [Pseudarthrobacter sp. NamE5]|uniref:hypothetical protein n=1 Tax=Pseudarthrobacter sp. NamE5 TaxID=2576839 RepID=UPI001486A4FC|nr:hypothetical protein [Pseudarthrobacter sp. NamE5]